MPASRLGTGPAHAAIPRRSGSRETQMSFVSMWPGSCGTRSAVDAARLSAGADPCCPDQVRLHQAQLQNHLQYISVYCIHTPQPVYPHPQPDKANNSLHLSISSPATYAPCQLPSWPPIHSLIVTSSLPPHACPPMTFSLVCGFTFSASRLLHSLMVSQRVSDYTTIDRRWPQKATQLGTTAQAQVSTATMSATSSNTLHRPPSSSLFCVHPSQSKELQRLFNFFRVQM